MRYVVCTCMPAMPSYMTGSTCEAHGDPSARLKAAARKLCEVLREYDEGKRTLLIWDDELAALERELEGRE